MYFKRQGPDVENRLNLNQRCFQSETNHPNVGLHAEVSLVFLLGETHLAVTLFFVLVLCASWKFRKNCELVCYYLKWQVTLGNISVAP